MRRIVMAVMGTISGLALLFSYHTSTNQLGSTAAGATGTGNGSSPGGTSGSAGSSSGTGSGSTDSGSGNGSGGTDSGGTDSGGSGSGSGGSSSGSSVSGTFTGDSVQTRWGPVQVQITVQNGKVTESQAVVYPQENGRDVEINNYALPILNQAAVQAQSAKIDNISGATVTSQGYIQSLQSAIDQAFA